MSPPSFDGPAEVALARSIGPFVPEVDGAAEWLGSRLRDADPGRKKDSVADNECLTGVEHPDIPNLSTFEGNGVSYCASPVEARLCAGEEIALVHGGNSAGQAIVFLAPQVRKLHLFVRRPLALTMSRYLIDRIAELPNVELHIGSIVVGLEALTIPEKIVSVRVKTPTVMIPARKGQMDMGVIAIDME